MTEVIGHDAVVQRFHQQMDTGKLHHAWLLHGPEGIGKRALANTMAQAYLCKANRDVGLSRPACGECHDCRMMAAGSHPDFMLLEREWDEKKKRLKRDVHIGQVRNLLGFLSLSGAESARRITLIGEAGRLNAQAANALLKGLEEPAAGSLLLLVCEDVLTLPATVRSRCLLQYLSPLPDDAMQTILADIQVPQKAMPLALRLAAGQPGKVAELVDAEVADALLAWQAMLANIGVFDIGQVQQWIKRYVAKVSHALIVDVVSDLIQQRLSDQQGSSMVHIDAVLDAARDLAAWPGEVRRRTLRPAPTLLAHMLSLRIALRELV
ncbi:MAG: DNA polymerase III subunit [Mariprofundaceae bacterium]|nr:DNA polymerase III subunit [Mariprofundaceae bacterium]